MRDAAGFLGTGASLASDLTLLAYLLFLLPGMLLGFYFARRKKFSPHHKLVMTTVVIINWILIGFLMLVSYREGVIPFLSAEFNADPRVALPIVHGVIGFTAQVLATYLALRMWFEKRLPSIVMVRNIKVYMRFTLAMWIVTAMLGVAIYAVWYAAPSGASADIPPGATPELAATDEVRGDPGHVSSLISDVGPIGLQITPAATSELVPAATIELRPESTSELNPASTPEIRPAVTPEIGPEFTPELRPAMTPEIRPAATAEIFPVFTAEVRSDAAERAARDALRATEDAIDALQRAARDAQRATEDAWDDIMDATEDAVKRRDDDDD